VTRRRVVLAAMVLAAAAAAAAVAVVLAGRGGGHAQVTEREYLTDVSAICHGYAVRLARVPAPANVTAYGDVVESLHKVLPLLRQQEAAMLRIDSPDGLQTRLDRLFVLNRRSIVELETTLAAAERRDAGGVIEGLGAFTTTRDRTLSLAKGIGIRC
jgi:hypothetical protein